MSPSPCAIFRAQLEAAAGVAGIGDDLVARLREPDEVLELSLPLRRDSGAVEVVKAWRSHHNAALGPYKGGIRYHPQVDRDEVVALSGWMTIKSALLDLPYGGAKGGLRVAPASLSRGELERLTRAYAMATARFIGADRDVPAPDVNTNPEIMGWLLDTYEKTRGERCAAAYTGKPVELGGSLGRSDATARGGAIILREAVRKLRLSATPTCAIQGYGNVGGLAHGLLREMGFCVVAVSDSKGMVRRASGLEPDEVSQHKRSTGSVRGLKGADSSDRDELLGLDVDVLVPAALEQSIGQSNVDGVRARVILELANGPTTPEADARLSERGTLVLPDVLANAGGVTVSWFEWIQGRSGDRWPEGEVRRRLDERMTLAFHEAWRVRNDKGAPLRLAAWAIAVERIARAMRARGVFP